MLKKCKDYLKYALIHFMSFVMNYFIFIILMLFINKTNIIGMQIVNLIAWIVSMLFIFYVDKKFVPDLVNEENSSELFKFILIRLLSLMIEVLIIFIFISICSFNYYLIKLISLCILFIFNNFYVKRIQII